jgi:hypothetical protein
VETEEALLNQRMKFMTGPETGTERGPTQIDKRGIYHTCSGTEETPLILDGKSEMDRKTELNS